MTKDKLTKKDVELIRDDFFSNIKSKTSKEIKKMKKLANSKKVCLKHQKRLFCLECFEPFRGEEKVRISKGFKVITCSCGKVKRMKLVVSC
ncbi:MAG: hypothetical protein PF542_05275 [Nanoarchaeota archaeon]|jgi:hypothetical protein|nr:hypothetical protein [Nanoarchaeota archaeon]